MAERITGHTELIGLMAYPIRHSSSPAMHNEAFATLGLDYAYLAFEVDNSTLEDAIKGLRALKMVGSNVSMPNKTVVGQYLDELSPAAEMCGAVNTIVNDNGKLIGHITDGIGFMQALKDNDIDVIGKKMTICGAGGAATAIEIQAALDGVKEISIFNIHDKFWDNAVETVKKINTKMELLFVPYHFLQSVVTKITGAVIVACSAYFYINGTMSAVYAIGMTISAFMLYSSLECAGNYSSLLHVVSVCVDKANAILELDTMDIDGKEIQPENYDIRLSDVSFSYDKRKIIDDVSLSIPQKTTTAIVGPSGGGKSTLCNLIARFWDVDSGEVTLGGENVKNYSMNSLMRNFSFVFQSVYLFADTIENNIKFGCQDASHEEVVEAAKKACCHDFISKLPNGYDTMIGEGGATLSGGEKQRISIARAIMKDAPIVILDEATANVDPENEKDLMDAVDALTKEKTIIMIAHRLKTVRHADQIVVVDKGRIVQQGIHEQLMKQEGIYKRFVDARQQAVSWKLVH